jgi:hypothetical protein
VELTSLPEAFRSPERFQTVARRRKYLGAGVIAGVFWTGL